jgi:curved DNA-binding protein CbpA
MSAFPDYYTLLGVTPSATQDQIRQAYKRESLKTHPDRLVNARPEERRRATEKFQVHLPNNWVNLNLISHHTQAIADAYYVLSDTKRRRDYDLQYESRSFNERTPDPDASANFFENFTNMFGAGSTSGNARPEPQARPDAEGTFTDVFEEVRLSSS